MSEPSAEPAAPAEGVDPPTPAEVEHDGTLAALREDVKELAGAVRGLLTRPTPAAGGGQAAAAADVGAEVQAELRKLQAAEQRKARAEGQASQIDQLAAQVKKLAEKPPREYRRITRAMGWVTEDDE